MGLATTTTVEPLQLTLWNFCTTEESTAAEELEGSLDLPVASAKPSDDSSNGNEPNSGVMPNTPSMKPNQAVLGAGNNPSPSSAATLVLNPTWRIVLWMATAFVAVSSFLF